MTVSGFTKKWLFIVTMWLVTLIFPAETIFGSSLRIRLAPQRSSAIDALDSLSNRSFGLVGDSLNDELAEQWIPQLREQCRLVKDENYKVKEMNLLQLFCYEIPVYGQYIVVQKKDGQLLSVNGVLPKSDTILEENLEFGEQPTGEYVQKTFYLERDRIRSGWIVIDHGTKILLDAQDHRLVKSMNTGFHQTSEAEVLLGRPTKKEIETVNLQRLDTSGYLNGKDFRVYAPDKLHSRVKSTDDRFVFDPEDQRVKFDQVQTYFNLQTTLAWFSNSFDYDLGDDRITVRTNAIVDNDVNNAKYEPGSGPGDRQLLFGRGSDLLMNLARDIDVAAHEFSHHVIYRSMPVDGDGAGMELHEGYADYFAYAMANDPYLAETVVPGSPYLRTAKATSDYRYDNPNVMSQDPHVPGMIWSALLWKLRSDIGKDFDQTVYRSLAYLNKDSDYDDAVLAILSADRDQSALAGDISGNESYGLNKCDIMSQAVERGYAQFMTDLDGKSCHLDFHKLANKSEESLAASEESKGKDPLKFCGVMGTNAHQSANWFLYFLLGLPITMRGLIGQIKRSR